MSDVMTSGPHTTKQSEQAKRLHFKGYPAGAPEVARDIAMLRAWIDKGQYIGWQYTEWLLTQLEAAESRIAELEAALEPQIPTPAQDKGKEEIVRSEGCEGL